MKAAMLFTSSGPIVILTSHESLDDPVLLEKLAAKGITKFIGFALDLDLVRTRYGEHFHVVCQDLQQEDDLRVLDFSGQRAWSLFSFAELGQPVYHESARAHDGPDAGRVRWRPQ